MFFGADIRKIGISLHTPVLLYIKVGFKGVYITRTCFRDGIQDRILPSTFHDTFPRGNGAVYEVLVS